MTFIIRSAVFFCVLSSLCFAQDNNTTPAPAGTPNVTTILAETVIVNAGFEEVAPCPCDLTQGSCDTGCCCDGDCTADDAATFDGCIPYLEGGQKAKTPEYRCSSEHFHKRDWFPFLCVQFEYNALLGFFYEWQYKTSNLQVFLNRLFSTSFYWFRETDSRQVSDSPGTGYTYGISLKTGKPIVNATLTSGVLTIPQPVLNGQCLSTAPVRFLKNIDSSCTYSMSSTLCSSASVLSQLFFIQSSTIPGSTTNYFSILQEDLSILIAETNVVYKCVGSDYLSSYLKSTITQADQTQQAYLFNYTLPSDPNCVDECGNDICIDLDNLTNPDASATVSNLPDCPSQVPTGPTLVGSICRNAVIDVDYQIRWAGNKIARLDAVVIMADIPLQNGATPNGPNVLTQNYKVTFNHNITVETNSTDNFNNITDGSYERSGKVGYEVGSKMASGSVVRNSSISPPEFMYVNVNSTRQVALFDTGPDGLCQTAGRRDILFGEDTSTSCKLMLGIAELTDCSGLRKLVINRLNAIMPSDVLGRRGYNDATNLGYWLNVLRQDLSTSCVLSGLWPLGLSPVDNQTGICYNMTNGIHLDVLYGETGQSNGFPILEILGSRVSFSNTTWSVSCPSLSGGTCSNGLTQPFYLTTSVKFIKIPPQVVEPPAKYYEVPEEDDVELCPGDRCWDNLFYPLTGRYRSNNREYVFGMASLTLIFFIGYVFITQPWW